MLNENVTADKKLTFKASCISLLEEENHLIAKKAFISKVTSKGFNLNLYYKDLIPRSLRFHLSLSPLIGKKILMYIPAMNMDLEGTITKAQHTGGGHFNIHLDFFKDMPQYWRECLFELWPNTPTNHKH